MEADWVLPGPDQPVPAGIVHESGRTRITRLVVPGGTVIRKEPLGPDGERRVRHEVAVLERLRGAAGVAQLAGAPRYPGSVVLADAAARAWLGRRSRWRPMSWPGWRWGWPGRWRGCTAGRDAP